jgi:hypothetical protein
VQREQATPLKFPPCAVSVPVCATWASTTSRPSLSSSPSCPLTHPVVDSFDGEWTPPCEPRRTVRPFIASHDIRRALRSATRPCYASRDLRRVLRPATCAVSCVPRHVPHLVSNAKQLRRALRPTCCSRPAAYTRPTSRTAPRGYPFSLRPTVALSPTNHRPSSTTTPNIIARYKAASFKH